MFVFLCVFVCIYMYITEYYTLYSSIFSNVYNDKNLNEFSTLYFVDLKETGGLNVLDFSNTRFSFSSENMSSFSQIKKSSVLPLNCIFSYQVSICYQCSITFISK